MRIKANYFSSKNYAEILNNINIDIGNMTSVADEGVFFVVTQAFSMVGGIIGLFILDYRMTLMVLLFIPVKAVIMKHFVSYPMLLRLHQICRGVRSKGLRMLLQGWLHLCRYIDRLS